MLNQWTAQLVSGGPDAIVSLASRVNAFRRQVEALPSVGGSASFVDGVTYLVVGDDMVAMVDYYAEEELMPE